MLQLKWAFLIVFILISTCSICQSADEKAILHVMDLEEQYWNAGDIEAYVSLYAPDDSTRMIYSTGKVLGKDSILAFYKKYWPKEKMGRLKLTADYLERVGKNYYFNSGYFEVNYPDKKDKKGVKGRFSGLMKKVDGKWYIYTDHSS